MAAGALTVAVVATVVIAAQEGPKKNLPVFLVLTHPMIRAGASDTVIALNNTTYSLNTTGAAISPRTSRRFSPGAEALMWDDPYNSVAPQSRRRILQPTTWTYPPGKYWVWMAYAGPDPTNETRYAYTKLTIVRR